MEFWNIDENHRKTNQMNQNQCKCKGINKYRSTCIKNNGNQYKSLEIHKNQIQLKSMSIY